jgi:hypothetical protein
MGDPVLASAAAQRESKCPLLTGRVRTPPPWPPCACGGAASSPLLPSSSSSCARPGDRPLRAGFGFASHLRARCGTAWRARYRAICLVLCRLSAFPCTCVSCVPSHRVRSVARWAEASAVRGATSTPLYLGRASQTRAGGVSSGRSGRRGLANPTKKNYVPTRRERRAVGTKRTCKMAH